MAELHRKERRVFWTLKPTREGRVLVVAGWHQENRNARSLRAARIVLSGGLRRRVSGCPIERSDVISHQAEAIVLRTWPIHEADLIVSLFTREQGMIKGVAKSASRSRRRFGGALEPMTHVQASFVERPKQDLVRLDSFEVLASPLSHPVDYARAAALAFFAEVIEDTLPEQDPQETVFRLLLAVLEHTRVNCVWLPVTYFALWMTRLLGWLPDLSRCVRCGRVLGGVTAHFHQSVDGLLCQEHKPSGSYALSPESQGIAVRIFRSPLSGFQAEPWPGNRAADLRRFALQALERHIEHRLATVGALGRLGG